MGSFTIWHWLVILIFYVIGIMVPTARILRRAGLSGVWCIFTFVPLLNIILLWVFAFCRWPNLDRTKV